MEDPQPSKFGLDAPRVAAEKLVIFNTIDPQPDPIAEDRNVYRQHELDAQARLAAIVDSSDDAIFSKTLKGVITSWNSSAQRLFGYSASEMVGNSITILIPPDHRAEELHILEQIRRGERIHHFETVRLTKDGKLVNVSLTISPIQDFHGEVIGTSKIMRDITQEKQAESALDAARSGSAS